MGDVSREIPLLHEGVTPDGLQQFLFGDQTVWMLSQEEQDVEGLRSERNGYPARWWPAGRAAMNFLRSAKA